MTGNTIRACTVAAGDHRTRCLFFFFQAEDGIRDYKVTGVQTCALPISETRIVCGRGCKPGAACKKLLRSRVRIVCGIDKRTFCDRRVREAIETLLRIERVRRSEPFQFVFRRIEVCVLHSERFEDAGTEEFVQSFARDHFHKPPEDIYSQTVFPTIPRIKKQRHARQALDVVFDGAIVRQQAVRNIRGGVERSKSVIPVVGEPRRVPQEVANGDLSRRRDCVGCAGRRLNQHFWILELWQIFRDRALQKEVALFVQHHHRHAGDGFGHRADPEHGVRTHRLTGRSEEHTSELQSPCNLVCRLLLEKKKKHKLTLMAPLTISTLSKKYSFSTFTSIRILNSIARAIHHVCRYRYLMPSSSFSNNSYYV